MEVLEKKVHNQLRDVVSNVPDCERKEAVKYANKDQPQQGVPFRTQVCHEDG
jgi:glutamine phosphoribosylpyrophosphate amidotransferase